MVVDKTGIKKNSDWFYANLDLLLPKYDGDTEEQIRTRKDRGGHGEAPNDI